MSITHNNLFNYKHSNISLCGIMILDPRHDFEPKQIQGKNVLQFFFVAKVGLTDLAVKVGCIDKPGRP